MQCFWPTDNPNFGLHFCSKFRRRPQLALRFTFERITNRFTWTLRWAHKKQRGLAIRLVSARFSVGGGWWVASRDLHSGGGQTTLLCQSSPSLCRPLHANGQTLRRHLSCVYKQQRTGFQLHLLYINIIIKSIELTKRLGCHIHKNRKVEKNTSHMFFQIITYIY